MKNWQYNAIYAGLLLWAFVGHWLTDSWNTFTLWLPLGLGVIVLLLQAYDKPKSSIGLSVGILKNFAILAAVVLGAFLVIEVGAYFVGDKAFQGISHIDGSNGKSYRHIPHKKPELFKILGL